MRCQKKSRCSSEELKTVNALLYEKGLKFGRRVRKLSDHEKKKSYPLRYPSNADSVGIEVVGRFRVDTKDFEPPTHLQKSSLKWLVTFLVGKYELNLNNDVYAHGGIARKQASEGQQLLRYLFEQGAQ